MSEIGQIYRVFGKSVAELKAVLDGIEGYKVVESQSPGGGKGAAFTESNLEPEPQNFIDFSLDDERGVVSASLWALDAHDLIVEQLNAIKATYLTYLYHTGAGFDELQIVHEGTLCLTEDLGELYQFTAFGVSAELEYDYERPDEMGRSFLKPEPLREESLRRLVEMMGGAASLVEGWEPCIEQDLPLYYLPGLLGEEFCPSSVDEMS